MDPPPQAQTTAKIRLMCSYGGHIKPLPCKKSLFYFGGDTRIITVPISTTASISAFSAHIAATLHFSNPFVLKYQLPLHDLDSLISLSSDDDLQIFLEEFQRLCSSPAPSRIRLFLFAVKQPEWTTSTTTTTQCGLNHPKTESWFVDALKSAKMMQKGEMGFGGEGQCQAENNGNVRLSGQESVVLETTSSFGSSSSSVSLSNLPPIKACGDDNITLLQDNKTRLPSSESTTSDIYSMGSAISYAQTGSFQDPIASFAAMGNKVSLNSLELSDTKIVDPVSEVPGQKVVQASGHQLPAQLDQLQGQQMPLVQMGTHYVPQNPTGVLPVASYYPIYNTPLHQQQLQLLPNQSYPVYVVPPGQTQLYESCAQYGSKENLAVVSGRPPLHPNTMLASPQVAYKDVGATPPIPEFFSHVYRTTPVGNSLVHVPYNENKQQVVVVPQIHNQPQLIGVGVASREAANYSEELDDDPARVQIYKSQPPPPTLPSQYQTMTKATAMLLSEALGQLHKENIKQQVRTSQPQ